MTSGRKLTEEQVDTILRLAGELDGDGEFLLKYGQIAKKLDVHRCTVYRCIRQAAVRWGKRTAWKGGEPV
jgi:DNA invertase Pin-like site-specific DNA recombinase